VVTDETPPQQYVPSIAAIHPQWLQQNMFYVDPASSRTTSLVGSGAVVALLAACSGLPVADAPEVLDGGVDTVLVSATRGE
jgi:hypothetical protein